MISSSSDLDIVIPRVLKGIDGDMGTITTENTLVSTDERTFGFYILNELVTDSLTLTLTP